MAVPMPAAVVLIVCKVVAAGPADQNSAFTGYQNLEWATEHSMLVCRRLELPRDPTLPCNKGAVMTAVQWDEMNKGSSYRAWRVACPVPIVNTITGEVIAWKMPECGHRDTVHCEGDMSL